MQFIRENRKIILIVDNAGGHILRVYEEKNKYEEIDVKQAIYYIREAWREVSKQTIKNCWKKTKITNDEENEDVVLVLEEEKQAKITDLFDFNQL